MLVSVIVFSRGYWLLEALLNDVLLQSGYLLSGDFDTTSEG